MDGAEAPKPVRPKIRDSVHRDRLNPTKWSQVNFGLGLMSSFKFICQSRLLKTLNPRPGELRRCTWRGGPHQTWMVEGPASGSLVWARVCSAALSLAKFIKQDKKKRTNKAVVVNAEERPAPPSEGNQGVNNCTVRTAQTRRATESIPWAIISSDSILNRCRNHWDKSHSPVRLLTDGSKTAESTSKSGSEHPQSYQTYAADTCALRDQNLDYRRFGEGAIQYHERLIWC